MRTRPAAFNLLMGRPSTVISSPALARSPSLASLPATVTRPASIQVSISRREPRPAAASSFCSLSAAGSGPGLFGFGGWLLIFNDFRRRAGQFERLVDLLQRRQLLEPAH